MNMTPSDPNVLASTCSARFWGAEDMRTCPAKGDGKLVMTSDIVSPLGLVRSLVIVCFSNSCDASEQHK